MSIFLHIEILNTFRKNSIICFSAISRNYILRERFSVMVSFKKLYYNKQFRVCYL